MAVYATLNHGCRSQAVVIAGIMMMEMTKTTSVTPRDVIGRRMQRRGLRALAVEMKSVEMGSVLAGMWRLS